MPRSRSRRLAAAVVVVAVVAAACGDDSGSTSGSPDTAAGAAGTTTTTTVASAGGAIVFNGQGNDLAAYSATPPFEKQIVIPSAARDPQHGLDINGQICFDPADPRRFVAGEDTDQSPADPPGWGVFQLDGDTIGDLEATEVAKLVPTYQSATDNAENYGCGFLPDGRIVTTDVGNQADGPADGQLIVWFPPFEGETNAYCKVDVTLATGQGVLVDDGAVYVAQARAPGVFRYDIDDLPTGPTPAGGCDSTDETGAPLDREVEATLFIEPDASNGLATPNGIARGPDGHLFVSSVINGVISEFDADGTFVRVVLAPPDGETLGAEPFSTGTPLGIGVDAAGNLYYADIGIVIDEGGIGPGTRTGTVRTLATADGDPAPPIVMDTGLAFPDGIGIWVPPS